MKENKTSFVRANITDTEKEIILQMADDRGMSVSSFVRYIIREYLKQNGAI